MSSFDWKKNIEDPTKDGLIITATTTVFALKAVNVKPPKAFLDAMDIMKLASGICGGVLVKQLKDCFATQKFYSPWRP